MAKENLIQGQGRIVKNTGIIAKFQKATVQKILDGYVDCGMFMEDFETLEPAQRISIAEKFFNYIAPKMQATSIEVTANSDKTIEDRLRELSQPNEDTYQE